MSRATAPFSGPVNISFDSGIIREALARAHALELADGDRGRLRPLQDGAFLVVNHRDFDTRAWERAKPRKGAKR